MACSPRPQFADPSKRARSHCRRPNRFARLLAPTGQPQRRLDPAVRPRLLRDRNGPGLKRGVRRRTRESGIKTGAKKSFEPAKVMASIPELFSSAVELHSNGDLEQARPLYEEVLRQDPRHADALN